MNMNLLQEYVRELLLEQYTRRRLHESEDATARKDMASFRAVLRQIIEDSGDDIEKDLVHIGSNSWTQAKKRGHSPPGTLQKPVPGVQISFTPESGLTTDEMMSKLRKRFGSANVENLRKGIYRSKYGTSKIQYDDKNYYLTIDDKKGDAGNIETGQIVGKAAEYALAAAMKSLPNDSLDLETLEDFYNQFLATKPEGQKVKAAPGDKRESFREKFREIGESALFELSALGEDFSGAKVGTSRTAIADIETDEAHVHVKYGSTRLGGIHRARDLSRSTEALDIIQKEIPDETSTDILDRAFQDLIEEEGGLTSMRLKEDKVKWIRDHRRKDLIDLLDKYQYKQALADDITNLLGTGNIENKKTYYITFSKSRSSPWGIDTKIEMIDLQKIPLVAVEKSPDELGVPRGTRFYKITNAQDFESIRSGKANFIEIEIRTDRKPQMHRGKDFNLLFEQ
jgi:hypothetical protein